MRVRRRHTVDFKREVVEQMKKSENIHALARELGIDRRLIYSWKEQFEGKSQADSQQSRVPAEEPKEKQLRDEITRLKSALAEKTLENDFFRNALLRVKEARLPNTDNGVSGSTTSSDRGSQSKAD